MKSLLVAAAALASVATVADAQAWKSINQRQASQFARINQGIRSGALTRAEATRLQNEFYALNRLEQRYRIGGLSLRGRQDLGRRFNAPTRRIRTPKLARQGR